MYYSPRTKNNFLKNVLKNVVLKDSNLLVFLRIIRTFLENCFRMTT